MFVAIATVFQSYNGGQLTLPHCSWARLGVLSGKPVLSARNFASSWQLSFLNQRKRENGHKHYSMISLTKVCSRTGVSNQRHLALQSDMLPTHQHLRVNNDTMFWPTKHQHLRVNNDTVLWPTKHQRLTVNNDTVLWPTTHQHLRVNNDTVFWPTKHKYLRVNNDTVLWPTTHQRLRVNIDTLREHRYTALDYGAPVLKLTSIHCAELRCTSI